MEEANDLNCRECGSSHHDSEQHRLALIAGTKNPAVRDLHKFTLRLVDLSPEELRGLKHLLTLYNAGDVLTLILGKRVVE